jgi:transposase
VSGDRRPRREDAEQLKRDNARLRQALAEAQRRTAETEKRLADTEQRLTEAERTIDKLEHQLALRRQNSTTTSKPPSSDGLAGAQRVRGRRKKSRRAAGGQPGHPGHGRPVVPAERVNAVVDLFPSACGQCQLPLPAGRSVGVPSRYQVTEVPAIAAHITEYRRHHTTCPDCGHVTAAALPSEVTGQFGPQLTALMAYLTVVCRLPRRLVWRLLEDVLHISLSVGSIQNTWEEASAAVAPVYAALEQALPTQPVLNADETGHRTSGDKRWLWVFVAQAFVFYRVATSRGTDVLRALLGASFPGILGSDRLPAYLKYSVGQRQLCWAHLVRALKSAHELAQTPAGRRFCLRALALTRRMFRLWHRFRGDPEARGTPLTRDQLVERGHRLATQLHALADQHVQAADRQVRNLACALVRHHQHLFTFMFEDGVDPTNNAAERGLRSAVIARKISFGTRSDEGERAFERLLTVVRTCQVQQISALLYLAAAIRAHRRRETVASLLHQRANP